jgi:hypothetical protein
MYLCLIYLDGVPHKGALQGIAFLIPEAAKVGAKNPPLTPPAAAGGEYEIE